MSDFYVMDMPPEEPGRQDGRRRFRGGDSPVDPEAQELTRAIDATRRLARALRATGMSAERARKGVRALILAWLSAAPEAERLN